MRFESVRGIMLLVLAVILLAVVYHCGRVSVESQLPERDTITDTIKVVHPVAVDSVIVRHRVVPIVRWSDSVSVRDSIVIRDSVAVVPITQKIYGDSTYKAWVSGYGVNLDSIHVFRPTITIKKPPNRWNIGAQLGVGLTPKGVQPYVGIGITYRIGI